MDLRLISSGSVASFHPIPPSHHHHHHSQIDSYHHHHNGSFGDPYHPHQQQIYHHQSADPYGHHGSSLAVYTGHNNHQWSSPMDDNHHHHPTFPPPPPPPPSNHHHHIHPHLLPISSPLSSSSSSSSLTSTPPSTYCLPFSPRSSNSSNISANSPGLISSPPSSISTSSQSDQQTSTPTIKPTIFTATTIDYYEPSSESPINQINPNSPSPSQSQQHQQQHPLPPTPPPSSSITTITQLNSLHNLPTIIQSTESINNNLTENENQSITLIETPMVDHTLTMNLNNPPTPTHHQLHHSNPHEHYHFNQGNELTEQSDGTIRFPRKRNTANKKERKRTVSINTAFSLLRDHIPNVPIDTKLSKIKTLRLATDYISYLMTLLETSNSPDSYDKHGNPTRSFKCEDFKVDLQRFKGARSETDLVSGLNNLIPNNN